jgi:hypothetical protein
MFGETPAENRVFATVSGLYPVFWDLHGKRLAGIEWGNCRIIYLLVCALIGASMATQPFRQKAARRFAWMTTVLNPHQMWIQQI